MVTAISVEISPTPEKISGDEERRNGLIVCGWLKFEREGPIDKVLKLFHHALLMRREEILWSGMVLAEIYSRSAISEKREKARKNGK